MNYACLCKSNRNQYSISQYRLQLMIIIITLLANTLYNLCISWKSIRISISSMRFVGVSQLIRFRAKLSTFIGATRVLSNICMTAFCANLLLTNFQMNTSYVRQCADNTRYVFEFTLGPSLHLVPSLLFLPLLLIIGIIDMQRKDFKILSFLKKL